MFRSIPALAAGILLGALPFSASAQTVSGTAPPYCAVPDCQRACNRQYS